MIISFMKKSYFISLFGKIYSSGPDAMRIPLNPNAWSFQCHRGMIGISAFGRHHFVDVKSIIYGGQSKMVTDPIGELFEIDYLGDTYLVQRTKQYMARGNHLELMQDRYTVISINGIMEPAFENTISVQQTPKLTIKHYLHMKKLFRLTPSFDVKNIKVTYLF
ncbi:hypothetical protein PP187_gp310 [Klebsiella phage vB_KvM-Eowyn]|uniref:Uncharacterized protein n=1 Tax=Klebsiella phage vB_KvM-Eowyn TaxID=2762819 RepID=A0A7R8R6K5_9CAUD|nr:hypothetical protein PP187_gp310 [Klebsiella phage vB_KvM-Eowyn]CAD5236299.1 hypothetical protein LLCLJKAH_00310 [Klebsiella phage vB_KvM-Eowyn]